jgi:predicted nucleic acid-binding protein
MHIFADTSIISRINDQNLTKQDKSILDQILKHDDIELYYSLKTREEINATLKDSTRLNLNRILEKTQLIKTWPTLSFTSGFPSQDAERAYLRRILYDTSRVEARAEPTNDGDLVFAAYKSNCDYFLTHDKNLVTIASLKQVELKKTIGKLQIVNLQVLGARLGIKI